MNMKAIVSLLPLLWMATAGLAQSANPSPAGSPQAPNLSLPAPRVIDAATRSNLMLMTPAQRRMYMLTNRPASAATQPSGVNPPVMPAASTTPATTAAPSLPAATNLAGAAPTNALPLPANPGPAISSVPATNAAPMAGPAGLTAPPTNAPSARNVVAGWANTNTNRSRTAPLAAGAAANPLGAGAVQAPPVGGAGLPGVAGTGPKTGANIFQPVPTGGVTNVTVKPSDDEIIPKGMIEFKEADLVQVLDIYAELTGRTILRPASLPAVKITLRAQTPLTRKEGIQALEAVFGMNQIVTVPMVDKFVKVIASAQAGNAGGTPIIDTNKIAEFGPFTTHIVQLKYADPTEVMPVIQPFSQLPNSIIAVKSSQILVLRDYAENIKRMMEMIDKVDVMVPMQYEPVVIPIKYALAGDIQSVLGSLTSGGGGGMSVGGGGAGG
ncbi:MAG: hypothetical protein NTW03_20220, partial [Verrucomicrobia bacterium]|nr:hypothetical protein [Verrucomicrobiota bacterium]